MSFSTLTNIWHFSNQSILPYRIWAVLCTNQLMVCRNTVTGANWNISKEDNLKIERQLKLLNKPAIKTIKTEYGDLYDCVNFFNQPAFDHPLLRNYTSDPQVIPPSILNIIRSHHSEDKEGDNIGLTSLECPIGSVPIRRVTKEDLIKDHLSSKENSLEKARTRHLGLKTTGTNKHSGAGAFISVHNPKVNGAQYSSARLRLTNGPDTIQAGWRVDPSLYRDNKTRMFVRTDAGKTQCYNTRCPGFVVVRRDFPPDIILHDISVQGGVRYIIKIFIIRDPHGNWNLYAGPNKIIIGYWPARLFFHLGRLASLVEWGGEVYSPPGSPFPPMGDGDKIIFDDTAYSAYFKQVSEYNEKGQLTDANNLQRDGDGFLYQIVDEGVLDKDNYKHWFVYGGPGGIKKKEMQI